MNRIFKWIVTQINKLIDIRIENITKRLDKVEKENEKLSKTIHALDASLAFTIKQNMTLFKAITDIFGVLMAFEKKLNASHDASINLQSTMQHLNDKLRFFKEEGGKDTLE